MSSVTGLLCYALSSSFKNLFGEWNLLKQFLYGVVCISICTFVLFAKKLQVSSSLMLKAHVGFLVLMITSVYSFFYDKAVKGKPDILGLISCGEFALMSFSLSRQIELGFEVDLLNFFLGFLTVQLMKINLMLVSVGAVFCYVLICLRSSCDSQAQIGDVSVTDHVTVEVAAAKGQEVSDHGSNRELEIEQGSHQQEKEEEKKSAAVTNRKRKKRRKQLMVRIKNKDDLVKIYESYFNQMRHPYPFQYYYRVVEENPSGGVIS